MYSVAPLRLVIVYSIHIVHYLTVLYYVRGPVVYSVMQCDKYAAKLFIAISTLSEESFVGHGWFLSGR